MNKILLSSIEYHFGPMKSLLPELTFSSSFLNWVNNCAFPVFQVDLSSPGNLQQQQDKKDEAQVVYPQVKYKKMTNSNGLKGK